MKKNDVVKYKTSDEFRKQINAVFEEKFSEIQPAIRNVAEHDDDLAQEGLIGAYFALHSDLNATKRYMVNKGTWSIISEQRRGKSVDYGNSYKRDLKIIHYQSLPFEDGVMRDVALNDDRLSVEDQAVFNVDFERFTNQLSPNEYNYVKCKLIDGLPDDDARKKLGLKTLTIKSMKRDIRNKLERILGVKARCLHPWHNTTEDGVTSS
jgi:DNA-directed RNA polymerase specialized sigma24 family protein